MKLTWLAALTGAAFFASSVVAHPLHAVSPPDLGDAVKRQDSPPPAATSSAIPSSGDGNGGYVPNITGPRGWKRQFGGGAGNDDGKIPPPPNHKREEESDYPDGYSADIAPPRHHKRQDDDNSGTDTDTPYPHSWKRQDLPKGPHGYSHPGADFKRRQDNPTTGDIANPPPY